MITHELAIPAPVEFNFWSIFQRSNPSSEFSFEFKKEISEINNCRP